MDRSRRAAGRSRVPAYTGFESFRDSASSPYARSERRRLSSEDTWRAINEKLHRLIRGISEHAAYRPVDIAPEQLHRWHRYLFGADFINGNGRLAFVALEAALRSQDLHVVTFDDIERHDQALGWALRDDCMPEYEPLARLVVEHINVSERDDPEYL